MSRPVLTAAGGMLALREDWANATAAAPPASAEGQETDSNNTRLHVKIAKGQQNGSPARNANTRRHTPRAFN